MTWRSQRFALLVLTVGLSITLASWTATAQTECQSRSTHVKAVASPVRSTAVTFNSNPLVFDPVPLISTTVDIGGRRPSCLITHFSASAGPMDNHIVFQVRVDGVPMEGHLAGFADLEIPVVVEPDYTDALAAVLGVVVPFADIPVRMVAHSFFTRVDPGQHTVEVVFAGCCSGNPLGSGAVVQRAVLTLEHVGLPAAAE